MAFEHSSITSEIGGSEPEGQVEDEGREAQPALHDEAERGVAAGLDGDVNGRVQRFVWRRSPGTRDPESMPNINFAAQYNSVGL